MLVFWSIIFVTKTKLLLLYINKLCLLFQAAAPDILCHSGSFEVCRAAAAGNDSDGSLE